MLSLTQIKTAEDSGVFFNSNILKFSKQSNKYLSLGLSQIWFSAVGRDALQVSLAVSWNDKLLIFTRHLKNSMNSSHRYLDNYTV